MVSRRAFLRDGASILAGAAIGPGALRLAWRGRSPKRVLVMGAGLAGLAAAYELDKAGHEVLVFEAKAIPGGRIHTLRAPFADGLYAEAGAMFVPEAHDVTLHYARAFELPLVQVTPRSDLGALVHVAGTRIAVGPGRTIEWPVPLNPDEAGQSIGALQRRYYYTPAAAIDSLDAADWPHAEHLAYDTVSMRQFWRNQGASEGAVRLMELRFWGGIGEGIDSFSALSALRDSSSWTKSTMYHRIQGGTDLLPRAFANRLAAKIRYGAPVMAIRHDPTSVEISIEDRAGRHQVTGDYLVCAIPFPVLRDIPVTPVFSATRHRAIREIQWTSQTRVYLQCRERFWEAEGQDGSALTDLPIQTVFHSTQAQPGARGILECYTTGARARRLDAMTPDDRLVAVLADMTKVHPRLPEYVEGGASYSWDNDPWARGDLPYFKPGQIREFFPDIQQPEGRIYLAGDQVAGIPGWMQGALTSGQRAAAEINAAP